VQDSDRYSVRGRRGHGPGAAVTLAALLALSPSVWAALGDGEDSVGADAVALKAVHRAVAAGAPGAPGAQGGSGTVTGAASAYTVHELQMPAGTTVHEFVSTAGVVFAVSWKGPFKPNLRQILGRYFDRYANGPRDAAASRSRLRIAAPDLVARSSGHMRAFSGLVYVPSLVPAGVTPGALR